MQDTYVEVPIDSPDIKSWTREDELELLTLVQLGLQTEEIQESHTVYMSVGLVSEGKKIRTCMVGAAVVGKFGGYYEAYHQFDMHRSGLIGSSRFTEAGYMEMFSGMLGINKQLLARASAKHMCGITIKDQIAALKANCYN